MANLNFQQPPRSVANQGLSRGGFSSSSLSGHVTPTSSLFPGGAGLTSSPFTQPLSPIRNLSNMGSNRGFPGQRPYQDIHIKRPLQGLGNNSLGSGGISISQVRQYGSQMGNFPFGGDTSTPPLLDLSEFPSLTNRGQSESHQPQPSLQTMPGKQPYVGMVKQPTSEASEFQMSSEDFPALPGTQQHSSNDKALVGMDMVGDLTHDGIASRAPGAEKTTRRGIQTSPDGKVTHIPSSMVKDQFGMIGLLQFIRAAESDSNLMSLALGQDLTALGLNLNQPDHLYQTFGGPFSDLQCRPQDVECTVPPEYLINAQIKDKLAPIKLAKYKDELVFYLFYTYPGDYLQLCAANELFDRDWRYHMDEKVWLTPVPGLEGTYYVFDPHLWRKVPKEFHLNEERLEGRPRVPQHSIL